jgi:uncharacterized protein YndB with AHSA1/START domain
VSEVRVEQVIDAPPATVYRYLTESARWSAWQGEKAWLEPRPGGRFSMMMGNGMRAEGEFVELVPDLKVVLTWGWVGHTDLPPGSTTVEIVLIEESPGTRVVLTHRSLPAEEVEQHWKGWSHYLPRLAESAAGRDPGPDPGP